MRNTIIIIPTFNHLDDCLKPCIESIAKCTDFGDESGNAVLVVANGCVDGTVEFLYDIERAFPWLSHVNVEEQLGYTKAVNVGLRYARVEGRFDKYVLLNNDTVLLPQERNTWLRMMYEGFADGKVAVTGPVMKTEEQVGLPFVIFCCAMISGQALDEIGLLDEEFSPGFGEDVDFCTRAIKAGYEIRQVPAVDGAKLTEGVYVGCFPIYHAGTKTFREYDGYEEIVSRNISLLMRKHLKIE